MRVCIARSEGELLSLRLSKFLVLLVILFAESHFAFGDTPAPELFQLLPDRVGKFTRVSTPVAVEQLGEPGWLGGEAKYSGNGEQFLLHAVKFHQDVEAYQILTNVSASEREKVPTLQLSADIGTAGFSLPDQVAFFKGPVYVRVTRLTTGRDAKGLTSFAQAVSDSLDKGEGEIPVLVKHLPNADEAQKTAVYLTRFDNLRRLAPSQEVLWAIDSGGNADAVIASIGTSKVLIVEFNTPQLASDNDKRIIAKIQELWKLGHPAPTTYRREGNYSVFVFDAPDVETAKQLSNQVKYEQVVQWLGENPNILKEAQQRYVNTTLGVFIAVLKASGFALIGCLGAGGLIGALLFLRRRSQQRSVEAFSDAGGMLRLNLDDLTHSPATDPARLLRDRN